MNDFMNKNCRNSQNSTQMSKNYVYIEKFLKQKPDEFNEDSGNLINFNEKLF